MKSKAVLLGVLVLIAMASLTIDAEEKLGSIDFPNSGKPEAQQAFIRAVLLLHSFEFEDAAEAFIETQEIDPDFALAYWGEAMTHNHPLWRFQDRDAALAALAKYAPTGRERLQKAPTERERGYLEAVEVLFGEGDKVARDEAYSEAMRELSERYPEDLEARSFYALSILGTAQGERDFATYMRAGEVTEEVFDANPQHPGAVHYMIHSYDDPVHAPLGLRAARVYAKIAPVYS
jgi:tetratricopeptide (TPR) repeat protein